MNRNQQTAADDFKIDYRGSREEDALNRVQQETGDEKRSNKKVKT